jgi:hypothetical protein
MSNFAQIDKKAYFLAKGYLLSLGNNEIPENLIEKYLNPLNIYPRPTSKEGVYLRILESAQNANMKAGVIGKAIDGVRRLSLVLENFNAKAVLEKYSNRWETVLDDIVTQVKPRGEIRRSPKSIWPHYCQTILSAAAFIEQFSSVEDFYSWVDFFDKDDRARASLPMLLSREIEGFGFALSCDFLKELGYINFPKPDVHLRDIFSSLELCQPKADDYQLFKSIIRLAGNANVSAYNADKVFWLIGSGFFYDDIHLGKNGKIGSQKDNFIEYARPLLDKLK